ncbi:MAG: biotin/lipoyl-containing protein [Promethearchaeota archaeon]
MMSSEYDLTIDNQTHRIELKKLDEGGLLIVKVGDESFTLKVSQDEDGLWCVNDTYTDHAIRILRRTGSSISLELNNVAHEIEWSRVRKETEVKTTAARPSGSKKLAGGVYPPMPGKITEVHVKVGDKVSRGQTVCILEAMKMFNELKAPSGGLVKEVHVDSGSNVTPDSLLILIE